MGDATDARHASDVAHANGHDASSSRSSSSDSGESIPPRRSLPKSRSESREVRVEVNAFLEENHINEEASMKLRALSPGTQRKVIARPLTGDVQNPSKVVI